MCTVSFVPVKDKCFITSNRDEKNNRKSAIAPAIYEFESGKVICPKDGNAGGSWIGLHENGNAAVLLNGAFKKHISNPPYRTSRGLIFLHVISSGNPMRRFDRIDLNKIEPFTMIIVEKGDLYECRWDSNRKYCQQLKSYRHYIWSSATLYENKVMEKREQWFASFLNKNPNPMQEDILRFHWFAGDGDKNNDIRMERKGSYSTVSITSILLTTDWGCMKHMDIREEKMYEQKIGFTSDCDIL
jgi:uncharacterized protein with NRDE domain